jgi:hypothetical protein
MAKVIMDFTGGDIPSVPRRREPLLVAFASDWN